MTMDEHTLERNDVLQKLLKSEYDLAKHEYEYYTQEFNKQDTIYGVYFAVFSVVIGAIYKMVETNNNQMELTNLAVILNQKIIIGGMILFLAFAYIYVFLVIMGNSYYLILYSEKIIVLERILNHYLDKNIFVWESCVMEQIQSLQNKRTEGYFNINLLKGAAAVILYIIVEALLGILWSLTFDNFIVAFVYCVTLFILSVLILMNWLIMWGKLPGHYKRIFTALYEEKLEIDLNEDSIHSSSSKSESPSCGSASSL